MPILLSIDTAGETATIGLGDEKGILDFETSADQRNHASFIQPAVQRLMQKNGLSFGDIAAVNAVNGPGSYTGLRVGLSSAKGITYATGAPLILLNTLTVMASAAIGKFNDKEALFCSQIDARRDEVFTALYNFELDSLLAPQPLILEKDSYNFFLEKQKVIFFGSGHNKCKKIISHKNAVFADVQYTMDHINSLGYKTFLKNQFADVAYSEPFYTKDFFH